MFSVQQSFIFGSHCCADISFAIVEIVPQFVHLVGLLALGHHRPSYPLACKRIQHAPGIDNPAVHIVVHTLCGQSHILILDGHITVVENKPLAVSENFHNRVSRIGECRHRKGTALQGFKGIHTEEGIRTVDTVPACKFCRIRRRNLFLRTRSTRQRLGATGRPLCQSIGAEHQKQGAEGSKVFQERFVQFMIIFANDKYTQIIQVHNDEKPSHPSCRPFGCG